MSNKKCEEQLNFTVLKKHNVEYEDKEMINDVLSKHFFMRILDSRARLEIIKEMTLCSIEQGVVLFQQGQTGNYFYIMKEGIMQIFIDNEYKSDFTRGGSIGELALIHSTPRSRTLIAKTLSQVWCLERKNFRKIVNVINKINYEENKQFISSVRMLNAMDTELKSILSSNLLKQYFEAGKYIYREGQIINSLYIIKEGQISCLSSHGLNHILNKEEYFGSVLLESKSNQNIIAKTDCVVYSISADTIKSMLGSNFQEILCTNFMRMAMSESLVFKKFNLKLLDKAFSIFKMKRFFIFETVLLENHLMSSLIVIIVQGNLIEVRINLNK